MALVVAFLDDLMFLSRIREAAAGAEVRTVRKAEDLVAAAREKPRLIVVDLDSPRIPAAEGIAAVRAEPDLAALPIVGFFSHVHTERARAAAAAGCTRTLPRSVFVRQLPDLLRGA